MQTVMHHWDYDAKFLVDIVYNQWYGNFFLYSLKEKNIKFKNMSQNSTLNCYKGKSTEKRKR